MEVWEGLGGHDDGEKDEGSGAMDGTDDVDAIWDNVRYSMIRCEKSDQEGGPSYSVCCRFYRCKWY